MSGTSGMSGTTGVTAATRVVAVTGASGYLGTRLCDALEADGWRVLRLVRKPAPGDPWQRRYELGDAPSAALLQPATALVHAAYDFGARGPAAWTVNVNGTRRLLTAAKGAGVHRVIVISSMSAYPGTRQVYGRVKLAIEAVTSAAGFNIVRPGFVYGADPGGIAGALRRVSRLPVVPLVASESRQFPVHDEDLVRAIVALLDAPSLPEVPIGIAQRSPVRFRDLLLGLALAGGRRPALLPVPWQAVFVALRTLETVGLRLPLRSDSLLGLVRPAPSVPNPDVIGRLGIRLREFMVPGRARPGRGGTAT